MHIYIYYIHNISICYQHNNIIHLYIIDIAYILTSYVTIVHTTGGVNSGNIALLCGPKGFTDDCCTKALKTMGYPENMIVTY